MKKIINQIALLGTSADPPTMGHEALLVGLLKLFPKVATWASNNPKKSHHISLQKREELLSILVESINHPNLELIQDLSSPWTIDTIQKASHKWPNSELIFVIGSDLIDQVPNWLDAKKFLNKTRLGIAPREGWPMNKEDLKGIKSIGGRVDILPLQIPEAASSEIRDNITSKNIPDSILRLVQKESLYKLKN
mgnify:CR=1 FL=1